MARKFLYLVAFIIVVVVAGRLALTFYPETLSRLAFTPSGPFQPLPPLGAGRYADKAMWIARPDLKDDPAHYVPEGAPLAPSHVEAAVFFVHPTSYWSKRNWNAPLDDARSREWADTFARGLASPFAGASEVWAPRYRQATFGAFLTGAPAADAALNLAYGDVVQAFDTFLAAVPADRPIVLVGHSQGAFHLRRLMAERIAGTPLARRVAAAYLVGWPLSREHDLPRLGLKPCVSARQANCVMSWLSFGDPAEPRTMLSAYARMHGLDGAVLGQSPFLCSNPLTGMAGNSAPAGANLGTLVPDITLKTGTIRPGFTGADCTAEGPLSLGGTPDMGPYVLPGNNYHVYDIPLFWINLRADYARRVAAWKR